MLPRLPHRLLCVRANLHCDYSVAQVPMNIPRTSLLMLNQLLAGTPF
jgi:hypothetical protein